MSEESLTCNMCKIIKEKILFLSNKPDKYLKTCISCREKHKCTVDNCKSMFARNSQLQRHKDSVHSKIKNYPCNYKGCKVSSSTKQNLQKHIDGFHLKKKCMNVSMKIVNLVLFKIVTYKDIKIVFTVR